MGVLADLLTILQSNWGWAVVAFFIAEQLFNPLWQTRFQTVLDERFGSVEEKLDDIDEKQTSHIQVTRALATKEPEIDSEAVDEYLVENGINKEDFYVRGGPHPTNDD